MAMIDKYLAMKICIPLVAVLAVAVYMYRQNIINFLGLDVYFQIPQSTTTKKATDSTEPVVDSVVDSVAVDSGDSGDSEDPQPETFVQNKNGDARKRKRRVKKRGLR